MTFLTYKQMSKAQRKAIINDVIDLVVEIDAEGLDINDVQIGPKNAYIIWDFRLVDEVRTD